MFKTLLIIVIISLFYTQSDFNNGFKDGYVEGYCFRIYNCIEPLVPIPPLPRIGEDTYNDGYNVGFIKGKNKRKNEYK